MPMSARVTNTISGEFSFIPAGMHEGRRQFVHWRDSAVQLLDDNLSILATRPLPGNEAKVLAANGLDKLAISMDGGLLILDNQQLEIPDLDCDTAAFIGDLLATARAGDSQEVLLVDPSTGSIRDRKRVPAEDAFSSIHVHPSEPAALLEFAMGQDGCLTYLAQLTKSAISLTEVLADTEVVLGDFSPSGDQVLLLPYPSDPEVAQVLSWPDLTPQGALKAEQLDNEIGIGWMGCWLDDNRVAIYAMEDSLVVGDSSFKSFERVELPVDFTDSADIEELTSLAPGRMAVGIWQPEGRSTLVVELC